METFFVIVNALTLALVGLVSWRIFRLHDREDIAEASSSVRDHLNSAALQIAIASGEVNASFCFLIIPILSLAPLMKRPYHFPNV